ncbi:MAG: hypothetical protein ACREFR_19515, partial [Limisphaerales bacterium]
AQGPFGLGLLFFTGIVNNPKVFYCPSVLTGEYSFQYYSAPGYNWPAMTPLAQQQGDGNPFVRCGYNYYPQSKITQAVSTSEGTLHLPAMTFETVSFNVPNPPGGASPNSTTEPAPIKTTVLNQNLAIAVDSLKTWSLINHKEAGNPYGLNAAFPDGHVRFEPVNGNNRKNSYLPFDRYDLWDPTISDGPGETSYSGSMPAFRIIMSGFQP